MLQLVKCLKICQQIYGLAYVLGSFYSYLLAFSTGMNIHVGTARAVLTGFNVTLTYTNIYFVGVVCIFIFILNCKMTWKKLSDSELGHHCLVEQ